MTDEPPTPAILALGSTFQARTLTAEYILKSLFSAFLPKVAGCSYRPGMTVPFKLSDDCRVGSATVLEAEDLGDRWRVTFGPVGELVIGDEPAARAP